MSVGTLIFFGFMFAGGLILWAFFADPVYFGVITVAFLLYAFHVVMSNTHNEEGVTFKKRSIWERLKPYSCDFCGKCFWTCKSCIRHEETVHPMQRRSRLNYYSAQSRQQNYKHKDQNPDAYLKPCTWCGGSGWKNGAMCDECGGTGKMFK